MTCPYCGNYGTPGLAACWPDCSDNDIEEYEGYWENAAQEVREGDDR